MTHAVVFNGCSDKKALSCEHAGPFILRSDNSPGYKTRKGANCSDLLLEASAAAIDSSQYGRLFFHRSDTGGELVLLQCSRSR